MRLKIALPLIDQLISEIRGEYNFYLSGSDLSAKCLVNCLEIQDFLNFFLHFLQKTSPFLDDRTNGLQMQIHNSKVLQEEGAPTLFEKFGNTTLEISRDFIAETKMLTFVYYPDDLLFQSVDTKQEIYVN